MIKKLQEIYAHVNKYKYKVKDKACIKGENVSYKKNIIGNLNIWTWQ